MTTSGTPRKWFQCDWKRSGVNSMCSSFGTGKKSRASPRLGTDSHGIAVGDGEGILAERASVVVYFFTLVSNVSISPGAARVVKSIVLRECRRRREHVVMVGARRCCVSVIGEIRSHSSQHPRQYSRPQHPQR